MKVLKVRIEDESVQNPVNGTTVLFYVRQIVTLADPSANRVVIRFTKQKPKPKNRVKCQATEREYKVNELIHIASARVARIYELHGMKYTRLSHVKLQEINSYANRF